MWILEEVLEILIPVGILLFALVLIAAVVLGFMYKSSCEQARIYNSLHATTYTCSDFFWAESQINNSTDTLNLNVKKAN